MNGIGFVSETDVIGGILKFDSFSNFYYHEYNPRKETTSINWFIDPMRCRANNYYAYQGVDSRTGAPVIGLLRLPTTSDEAFMVAHEIGHVFRKIDGLSLSILERYYPNGLKDLAMRIGSMFDDPLIDSFLQDKYNFNSAYHYSEIDIPHSFEILNSPFGDPQSDIDKLRFIIYYTTRLLQYDSIKDTNALQKWYEYQKLFESKLGLIAKSGKELYYITKENGYDTLEKQKRLFNKISDKYTIEGVKLGDILFVE